jgi:hypothetical protein
MNTNRKNIISNFLCIPYFEVPKNWVHVESTKDSFHFGSLLSRKDNPNAELFIWRETSPTFSKSRFEEIKSCAALQILDQPAHEILPGDHHLAFHLSGAPAGKAPYRAWTESLNGQIGMFVETALLSDTPELALILNRPGERIWLEKISFTAPRPTFAKYYDEAIAIMRSLPGTPASSPSNAN